MLTSVEALAIQANLFHGAHWVLHENPAFPWHRDRAKAVTASAAHSSQALALDVFATVERLASRDAILDDWASQLALALRGPWSIVPEYCIPASVLGEPKSTQVDAVAQGSDGIALFECKFTESQDGSCSQPRPIAEGARKGLKQCNGRYESQERPTGGSAARCTLTAKGVTYWDSIPDLFGLAADIDHRPCPFAGERYQWMRNVVAASALAKAKQQQAAFVVVYAEGPFPMASYVNGDDWAEFMAMVRSGVAVKAVSYQQLLQWAKASAKPEDREVLHSLDLWFCARCRALPLTHRAWVFASNYRNLSTF